MAPEPKDLASYFWFDLADHDSSELCDYLYYLYQNSLLPQIVPLRVFIIILITVVMFKPYSLLSRSSLWLFRFIAVLI